MFGFFILFLFVKNRPTTLTSALTVLNLLHISSLFCAHVKFFHLSGSQGHFSFFLHYLWTYCAHTALWQSSNQSSTSWHPTDTHTHTRQRWRSFLIKVSWGGSERPSVQMVGPSNGQSSYCRQCWGWSAAASALRWKSLVDDITGATQMCVSISFHSNWTLVTQGLFEIGIHVTFSQPCIVCLGFSIFSFFWRGLNVFVWSARQFDTRDHCKVLHWLTSQPGRRQDGVGWGVGVQKQEE